MIRWPNLGLFGDFEVCEAGVLDAINKNFFILDVLVQMGVIDFVATLPLDPAEGDIYILTTDDTIQAWNGTEWIEIVPKPGEIAYITGEDEFYWYTGTQWIILPKEFGDVVGPATSNDNRIARFDGTDGKTIQNSLVSISDAGVMSGAIETITDLVTTLTVNASTKVSTDLTETNLLSTKAYIITGVTGAITLATPTALVGKIQSAVTQINNITAPTGMGTYNRVHILVNETLNDIVISDAGNIRTGLSSDLNLKSDASVMIMYDYALNIWRVIGGSGGGSGGSGGVNFILNPDAEAGIKGYALYKDAAVTRPVDGTGGTSTLTLTTSGTAPLSGKKSFIITKPSLNTQGEGVSYDFAIDIANKAKVLQISFDYLVNSGTFVAGSNSVDGDMIIYLYDITNSRLIEPSNIKLLSSSTTLSDKYRATFQTSSDSVNYRLIFHCASTSALAYSLKVDNISISPSVYVSGSPVTDWQSYTPIFTGIGSVTSSIYWRQVGTNMEIRGRCLAGTSSATTLSVTLANGAVASSSSLSNMQAVGIGFVSYTSTGLGNNVTVYATPNTSTLTFQQASIGTINNGNGSGLFAINGELTFTASIPIQGWSASTRMSDGYDGRVITFSGTQSSQAVTALVTSIAFTTIKDSVGAWNGTQYEVKTAGDYVVAPSFISSAGGTTGIIYVNGSVPLSGNAYTSTTPTGGTVCAGSIILTNLKVGDLISVRSNVATTISSGQLGIYKLSGSQTISASALVYARATIAGSTAITTVTAIPYNTVAEDTHGRLSSPGRFTAGEAGLYMVGGNITSAAANSFRVFKNGLTHQYLLTIVAGGLGTYSLPVKLNASEYVDIRPDATSSTSAGFTTDFWVYKIK